MAILVIGGHSKEVGKTSVMAGLIEALRESDWLAVKITQFDPEVSTPDPRTSMPSGRPWIVSEEHDANSPIDTSRYLAAGARRCLWVRTQQGKLAAAMPQLRVEIAKSRNTIIESNSILRYLRPDLYVTVLDAKKDDFKSSAREHLDKADAVLWHKSEMPPRWEGVSLVPVMSKPLFHLAPPEYLPPGFLTWVKHRLEERAVGVPALR